MLGKIIVGIKLSVNCVQGLTLFYGVIDFTVQVDPRAHIQRCASEAGDAGNLQVVDAPYHAIAGSQYGVL